MSKFKHLNENITNVLLAVIGNQKLCKLIAYNTDNPYDEPDIDAPSLISHKIHLSPKIPEATTEMASFLNIYFDTFRLTRNNGLKEGLIVFDIVCHLDLWVMGGTGMIRPLSILHEVDEMFNQQRIAGVKKLQFYDGRFINVNEKYAGYQIRYEFMSGN